MTKNWGTLPNAPPTPKSAYDTAGKSFLNLTLWSGFSLLEDFLKSMRRMYCEFISKILNFSRQLKKRTMLNDKADVSGSIANRSNFMSDCKQMQARLKIEKYIHLKRKKYQANMLQNRFELCWRKLLKFQCKTVSSWNLVFYAMFTVS